MAARAREAERLLRDVIAAGAGQPANRQTAESKSRLGGALVAVAVADPDLDGRVRLAKFTEAEPLLLEDNQRKDALIRLVRLYEAWDKLARNSGKRLRRLRSGKRSWPNWMRPRDSGRQLRATAGSPFSNSRFAASSWPLFAGDYALMNNGRSDGTDRRTKHNSGGPFAPAKEMLTTMKTRTILAIVMVIIAIHVCVQGNTAGQPVAAAPTAPRQANVSGVRLMRVANLFAGTYCGSLGFLYAGSITISNSGRVSGFFDAGHHFEASLELKGKITSDGVMHLRVVDSYSDGGFSETERYSFELTVALDESRNLAGTWDGTPFVWAPCQ